MVEFRNVYDLDKALKFMLRDIVETVAKKVEEKVKEHIDIDVYSYEGNYYYNGTGHRTGEFRESWTASEAKSIPGGFQSEVASDPTKMRFDADTYLHGSFDGDIREYLSEIINDGLAGDLFGDGFWRQSRPFFSRTVQELMNNGLIYQWFREEFTKKGISIKY